MLSFVFILISLIASVYFVIVALPYCIANVTSAENEPNHIYTIFWERAGFRGIHLLGACFAFMPLIFIGSFSPDITGFIFVTCICAYGVYEHSQLHKNVNILNKKLYLLLLFTALGIVSLGLFNKYHHLSDGLFGWGYIILCSSFSFYVNLIGSRQIQHNKSLKRD